MEARYYQHNAINRTLEAIAGGQERILLTMATGTGKTFVAFQLAWKLFQSRWTLARDGKRRPRVLFLADRNILADQAYNAFSAFPEDALARISPSEIRKKGRVPKNASIFLTIFQTFMTGADDEGNDDRQKEIYARFRRWYVSGMDPEQRDRLLDEAQQYNLRVKRQGLEGSVPVITLDRIRGILRAMARPPRAERNR